MCKRISRVSGQFGVLRGILRVTGDSTLTRLAQKFGLHFSNLKSSERARFEKVNSSLHYPALFPIHAYWFLLSGWQENHGDAEDFKQWGANNEDPGFLPAV